MNTIRSEQRVRRNTHQARGLTRTDLIVAVATGALLTAVLLPSAVSLREHADSAVCLGNMRALGMATRLYADETGRLPGLMHPAVSRGIGNMTLSQRQRQFLFVLSGVLGDAINDSLGTCPTMARINPDYNFEVAGQVSQRYFYPTHYSLNNWGTNSGDGSGSTFDGVRTTNPAWYFGYVPVTPGEVNPPRRWCEIPNPQREWLLADAWYRNVPSGPAAELQQEGPYQADWSGIALPNFAPHLCRVGTGYAYTSEAERNQQSAQIRTSKADGVTNTVFFDGHAAGVPSRTYVASGWELLYGFPGTVNPRMQDPAPNSNYWKGYWR